MVDVASDFLSEAIRRLSPKVDLPPIVDFAEHEYYLGSHGNRLYPRQKTLLRLMCLETETMTAYDLDVIGEWTEGFYRSNGDQIGVSPDVWKRVDLLKARGFTQFREVINVSGRRGSKGHLGAIMGARQNLRLLELGDPQKHYGIDSGKELYQYVAATTLSQAVAYQFADLRRALSGSPYFQKRIVVNKPSRVVLQTDADKQRELEMRTQGMRLDDPVASIFNLALSANSAAARGGAAFGAFFDEFAHMLIGVAGSRSDEAVYKAITPSLGQVDKDAFIYVPSSPVTRIGRCFELAQQSLQQDEWGDPAFPTMLLVQLPSHFLYIDYDDPVVCQGHTFDNAPEVYGEVDKELERRDPITYRVEKRAQWSDVVDAFLSPELVDRLFAPIDGRVLTRQDQGVLRWIYRGHADPAAVNDNFALCIGHMEEFPDSDGEMWSHVLVDHLKVWSPVDYEDGHIDYGEVEEDTASLILAFPALKVFSYDQYGSFITVPQLRQRLYKAGRNITVKEVVHTAPSNRKRWDDFRAALGMDWIHSYRDSYGPEGASLLELEARFLQRRRDKVDHPAIGPVRTDDLITAVSVVVTELLGDQLEKLRNRQRLGETQLSAGAPGGYHSGTDMDARSRLNALSQAGMARSNNRVPYNSRRSPR